MPSVGRLMKFDEISEQLGLRYSPNLGGSEKAG
jgi:hypothetical protein